MASAVLAEASGDISSAVRLAYQKTVARVPTSTEMDRALRYVDNEPGRLKGLAWLLFNLDEFIYVR